MQSLAALWLGLALIFSPTAQAGEALTSIAGVTIDRVRELAIIVTK